MGHYTLPLQLIPHCLGLAFYTQLFLVPGQFHLPPPFDPTVPLPVPCTLPHTTTHLFAPHSAHFPHLHTHPTHFHTPLHTHTHAHTHAHIPLRTAHICSPWDPTTHGAYRPPFTPTSHTGPLRALPHRAVPRTPSAVPCTTTPVPPSPTATFPRDMPPPAPRLSHPYTVLYIFALPTAVYRLRTCPPHLPVDATLPHIRSPATTYHCTPPRTTALPLPPAARVPFSRAPRATCDTFHGGHTPLRGHFAATHAYAPHTPTPHALPAYITCADYIALDHHLHDFTFSCTLTPFAMNTRIPFTFHHHTFWAVLPACLLRARADTPRLFRTLLAASPALPAAAWFGALFP